MIRHLTALLSGTGRKCAQRGRRNCLVNRHTLDRSLGGQGKQSDLIYRKKIRGFFVPNRPPRTSRLYTFRGKMAQSVKLALHSFRGSVRDVGVGVFFACQTRFACPAKSLSTFNPVITLRQAGWRVVAFVANDHLFIIQSCRESTPDDSPYLAPGFARRFRSYRSGRAGANTSWILALQ